MNPWWRPENPVLMRISGFVVEYALRGVLALVRWLPASWVDGIGSLAGILLPRLARKDAAVLAKNVEMIMGLPGHSVFAKLFSRQCFRYQALSVLETIRGCALPAKITFNGFEDAKRVITKAAQGGRGVVMVAGHAGSWELSGVALASMIPAGKGYVLAKPAKNEGVTRVLDRIRCGFGVGVIWTGSPSTMESVTRLLGEGAAVGFIMDQKPGKGRGVEVSFLGQKTSFPAGAAVAALAGRSSVVSFMAMREGPMSYRMLAKEILPSGFSGETVESVTAQCAVEIERVVRQYPEQWVWNYKRWKWA